MKTGVFWAVFVAVLFLGIAVGIGMSGVLTGEAIKTSIAVATDSDNGLNYYEKGTCNGVSGAKTDYCIDNTNILREYRGVGSSCVLSEYDCANENMICSNGACVSESTDAHTEMMDAIEQYCIETYLGIGIESGNWGPGCYDFGDSSCMSEEMCDSYNPCDEGCNVDTNPFPANCQEGQVVCYYTCYGSWRNPASP